jgi:hypothetical protein
VVNNVAAGAVREPYSLGWFDYDLTAAIAFPGFGGFGQTDFANRGQNHDTAADNFQYYDAGATLQFGEVGDTILGDILRYDATETDQDGTKRRVTITQARFHLAIGYGMFQNQLILGLGARVSYVDIGDPASTSKLVSFLGAGPEFGLVVKPDDTPLRVGGTLRTGVTAHKLNVGDTDVDPATGASVLQKIYFVPGDVVQPWELELGVAWQLGPRPFNPPWINPKYVDKTLEAALADKRAARRRAALAELEAMPAGTAQERGARNARASALAEVEVTTRGAENDELRTAKQQRYAERKARYLNWPRERITLFASLLVVGQSEGAVAIDGFLARRLDYVGTRVNYGPRFAVESEAIPNLLRLRSGVYVEPSRFQDGHAREHFTFGADLRAFSTDVFGLLADTTYRLSGFLDVSARYANFGFGIGAWH